MKYIITENQRSFIRRYSQLKELIDEGIDVLSQDDDICSYSFSDFLSEVSWQVSDKVNSLNLPDNYIGEVHRWVRFNFTTYIREEFDKLMQLEPIPHMAYGSDRNFFNLLSIIYKKLLK